MYYLLEIIKNTIHFRLKEKSTPCTWMENKIKNKHKKKKLQKKEQITRV